MKTNLKQFGLIFLAVLALIVVAKSQTSNSVGGLPIKWVLQSTYTNATTSFTNISGASFTVTANTPYTAQCYVLWNGSAVTTGPQFQWTGPASPVALATSMHSDVLLATGISAHATGFSSPMSNSGTVIGGSNEMAIILMGMTNGANPGTIQLQAAANGLGTLTIQQGSSCVFQ